MEPEERGGPIRVLLADDDSIFVESLRPLIDEQPELAVVGAAADGLAAIELCEELHGEVLTIVDGYALLPTKPGLGIDLDEKIAAKHPYVAEYEVRNRAHLTWADGSLADP